jgi:transposase
MPKKYPVRLTKAERAQLETLIASGRASARSLTHARILLKADEATEGPAWKNAAIADALEVSELTVTRVRKRWTEGGVTAATQHKPQARRKAPRLDGAQEAYLLALACGEPPAGRARWTLRLLADRMVALQYVEEVSHETVRQVLKKGSLSLG